MSKLTYSFPPEPVDKPLVWISGEIHTPPFSMVARREAGALLRELQKGLSLGLPHSRPMPVVGPRCHELRVTDGNCNWRIVYRVEPDAVVILDVFQKKSQTTPKAILDRCQARLVRYLQVIDG